WTSPTSRDAAMPESGFEGSSFALLSHSALWMPSPPPAAELSHPAADSIVSNKRVKNQEIDVVGASPPPAEGVRFEWAALPGRVRAAVEERLGSRVVSAETQPTGFSPGVAARLLTADGRRVFVKAVGPEPNPGAPYIHRREASIVQQLPSDAPVP